MTHVMTVYVNENLTRNIPNGIMDWVFQKGNPTQDASLEIAVLKDRFL